MGFLKWAMLTTATTITIATATYFNFWRSNKEYLVPVSNELHKELRDARNELLQLEERILELRLVIKQAKELSQN